MSGSGATAGGAGVGEMVVAGRNRPRAWRYGYKEGDIYGVGGEGGGRWHRAGSRGEEGNVRVRENWDGR